MYRRLLGPLGAWLPVVLFMTLGCQREGDVPGQSTGFDRRAMLTHLVDNLALPAFEAQATRNEALLQACQTLSDQPGPASLEQAKQTWREAFLQWQHLTVWSFGPGELNIYGPLRDNIGLFPVAVTQIEGDIAAGVATFENFRRDRRGLLTLDYLLFDPASSDELLGEGGAQRRAYVLGVARDIKMRTDQAAQAWRSQRAAMIENAGTDAGSTTSQLFNNFSGDFESVKNYELGLPLGVRPGQNQPEPSRVEAFYSGLTREALIEHLLSIENLYLGRTREGVDGPGFDDYLLSVVGGSDLVTQTKIQYGVVMTAAQDLPTSMTVSDQIRTAPAPLSRLHTELQRHTRFFKSEMSSLLGIAITFQSGDGD